MKNYILFSAPRTGSTYFAAAIAKQLSTLEPNTFDGGEYFRWSEYLQLGAPGTTSPGNLGQLEMQPELIEEYENTKPRAEAPYICMGEGGIIEPERIETTWGDRGSVSFRRAWEESQRRLTLLENSYFPWVVKVHAEVLNCMDMRRFNRLVDESNTCAVILYRSNMWDWFLSWVALRKTGIFQKSQRGGGGGEWDNKPEVVAQDLSADFVKQWYGNARDFVNMVLSYRSVADHIIDYEELTGEAKMDAGFVTGIGLYPENTQTPVKLWSREEKEKMISNIDEIKTIFSYYCKILGYPDGKLVF